MTPVLLPLLSGGLWVLCYPKADLGPLAWVALVPLCLQLSRARTWRAASGGALLAGTAFYLGLMYWIVPTCRAGGVSPAVSILAWIGLALVMALHWALFGLGVQALRRLFGEVQPAMWGVWWVGVEWLSARWTTQFPWGLAGYTQWRFHALVPVCSVFGIYGLSFLVVTVNAALAAFAADPRRWSRSLPVPAGLFLTFLALGAVLGPRKEHVPDTPISILQGNIDQYKKWDAAFEKDILTIYQGLAADAGQAVLVAWPESALPGWFDQPGFQDWLSALAAKTQTYHLVGAVTRQGGAPHNSAVLIDPEGHLLGMYHKRHLVPFGETVPLQSLLASWVPVLNELGSFLPGQPDQPAMRLFWGTLSPSICYEAIFPDLLRNRETEGARLLVNLTNDGWYLDTAAPYQHFAMAAMRAAENRAYLVRAANTGISALVDPFGRVVAATKLGERTVLKAKFSMELARFVPSVYAMIGDVFAALCLGGTLGAMALGIFERRP